MLSPCLVPFLSKGKISFAHKMKHKVGNLRLCLQYKSPWKKYPQKLKDTRKWVIWGKIIKEGSIKRCTASTTWVSQFYLLNDHYITFVCLPNYKALGDHWMAH